MGKSLVAATDLPAGHTLREEDVAAKSPGGGLPPYELEKVVGRTLNHPVSADMAFTFELLDEPALTTRAPPAPTCAERRRRVELIASRRPSARRGSPARASSRRERVGARGAGDRDGERRPRGPRGRGHGRRGQPRSHFLRCTGRRRREGRGSGPGASRAGGRAHAPRGRDRPRLPGRGAGRGVRGLGVPSVLVNGAGIDQPPDAAARTFAIEDVPADAFRQTLDVNLVGHLPGHPGLRRGHARRRRGSIVNIGSLYATFAPGPSSTTTSRPTRPSSSRPRTAPQRPA